MSTVPRTYPTVAPYLIVEDAHRIVDFLESAFDGTVVRKAEGDSGRIAHAEVRIQDSVIMLGSSSPEWPALRSMIHLYLPDVDAWYRKALDAGATSVRAPADMDYGDRSAGVMDPAGNQWWIACPIVEPSS